MNIDKDYIKNNEDLYDFFDTFIKKGYIEKEDEVLPGLKVKLRPLSSGESFNAEAVVRVANPNLADITSKVRSASILSRAIIKIGKNEIETQGMRKEEIDARRDSLYKMLLELPPYALAKIYDLYIYAVAEQNRIFSNPEETKEKIQNF